MQALADEEFEAIHTVIRSLERRWELPTPDADVFFAYDPYPPALFFPGIRVAIEHAQEKSFLDVGCGIGTKLVLMAALGFRVAGIDRYRPYIDAARELCPDETELVCADLRDIDRFDAGIVYMYRPGVSDQMASDLERHVVDRLADDTVLFLPAREIPDQWGLERVAPEVWVK